MATIPIQICTKMELLLELLPDNILKEATTIIIQVEEAGKFEICVGRIALTSGMPNRSKYNRMQRGELQDILQEIQEHPFAQEQSYEKLRCKALEPVGSSARLIPYPFPREGPPYNFMEGIRNQPSRRRRVPEPCRFFFESPRTTLI